MPQVTCPNCGTTINLENRKEIDLDLIKSAARREPRTFTELLHVTRLPRKTLSLRLKQLCEDGTLIKMEGVYKLNGMSGFEPHEKSFANGFSRVFSDRRMRTGLMLVAFLLCSTASGFVLASFMAPPGDTEGPAAPKVLGTFTMTIKANDVNDMYVWQVLLSFDTNELTVTKTSGGDFFEGSGSDPQVWSTVDPGTLMLLGSLIGDEPGRSGSYTLATVEFGYYVEGYKQPGLVAEKGGFEASWIDSGGSSNLFTIGQTLTLE